MASSRVTTATVYVVRHGECIGNKEHKTFDPFDDILTDLGKEQAKILGEHIKDINFTRVYSSDYPRAADTAKIALAQNPSNKVEVHNDVGLRERTYTGLIGLDGTVIITQMVEKMKAGAPYLGIEMENCETIKEFENRLISFMSNLFKELRNSSKSEETVMIVSHGLAIQRLMVLLNSRPKDFGIDQWTPNRFSERLVRNTGFHKLVFEIPEEEDAKLTGKVDYPHYRIHTEASPPVAEKAKETNTNGEADEEVGEPVTFQENINHYCRTV